MATAIISPNVLPYSKNTNFYFETVCKDCGEKKMRRSDAIKKWNGRCWKCAAKVRDNHPDVIKQQVAKRLKTISEWPKEKRAAFAEHARQQVLRQGGIPNAKPFAKEGEGRRMAGANHYAWKGGVTSARMRDMNTARYIEWRKAVFNRDSYTCQHCGSKKNLEADHILPYSTHVELRYEVSNGRTLCKPCHQATDTYGTKALRFKPSLQSRTTC